MIIEFFKRIKDFFIFNVDIDPSSMINEMKVHEAEPIKSAKAEVAERRTRKKGKFVGDDKRTPAVNEAYKEGVKPAPKKRKPKKPDLKVQE